MHVLVMSRCKLFYQKSGQWADRGMGNLHLKVTESKRTQLIVRADTILGMALGCMPVGVFSLSGTVRVSLLAAVFGYCVA